MLLLATSKVSQASCHDIKWWQDGGGNTIVDLNGQWLKCQWHALMVMWRCGDIILVISISPNSRPNFGNAPNQTWPNLIGPNQSGSGSCRKIWFLSFFWCPYFKKQQKILSSTFLRDFYKVWKIDQMFNLSLKHCFGFYGIHGYMCAYIIVEYVYHIILIVSLLGLQCRSSMDDILPFWKMILFEKKMLFLHQGRDISRW